MFEAATNSIDYSSAIGVAIITGLISSVVAAIVFLIGSRVFLTPKISIAPRISSYPNNTDGSPTYRIKIRNDRFRSVSDVDVDLFVEHTQPVHGGDVRVRRAIPLRSQSRTIQRRMLRDTVHDECKRLKIETEPFEGALRDFERAQIVVEVYGRDSWSGVGRVFRQTFTLGMDSVIDGSFVHGRELKIEPRNPSDQFAQRTHTGPTESLPLA